ncbi:MAG TPA: glucoamylase family protein, partial [Limnochordia bacterium]|nr:glucoamylase family protein [Limnochordia bacterium]
WMCAGGTHLHMGWTPERGYIPATWSSYNELIALLVPALGSPTHPLPARAWRAWERPLRDGVDGPVVYCRGGDPLFVHYYAQLWIDLRDKWDGLVDYHANTAEAIALNQAFCARASAERPGYDGGRQWGLTASDGPKGYQAYGAWPDRHDGTLAPYAVVGALPWRPQLALATLRRMYEAHKAAIWGPYGFWSAYNAERCWYSQEAIGIDVGTVLLGVIAAQDALVWRATARHPFIRRGLAAAGFGAAPPGVRLAPDLAAAGSLTF